ncbi:MAG TPA: transposase, partial [Candidatus Competibacteraceae bacterium]|nr:transposase [Candidatus Competibacteraceae bacterium]
MTKCTASMVEFPRCQRRRVQAEFSGGAITSDGGVVLLRQGDQRIGLTERLAQRLPDP